MLLSSYFRRSLNGISTSSKSFQISLSAVLNDLYSLGKKKFKNFYELWKELKKKKSLNSAKINTLIEIGYFDDFGSIGKIKRFVEILDKL